MAQTLVLVVFTDKGAARVPELRKGGADAEK